MILFEQAYEIVFNQARVGGTEQIELNQSLNRILAEDVLSDMDNEIENLKEKRDKYKRIKE